MMKQSKPVTAEVALAKMQTMCAKVEHCTFEITTKLRRMALPSATVSEIIESLQRNRFIDDTRYAKALARDKARFAGWGPRKIAISLRMKQIDQDIVTEALASVPPDAYETAAIALAKTKARALPRPMQYEQKAKLYASLSARGFDSATIQHAISVIDLQQE